MGQILAAIIAIILLATALKLALIFIVLAGLIFRTKETIGLLLLGWAIVGFTAHPLIGTTGVIALLCFSLYMKNKEKKAAPESPQLIEHTDQQ